MTEREANAWAWLLVTDPKLLEQKPEQLAEKNRARWRVLAKHARRTSTTRE